MVYCLHEYIDAEGDAEQKTKLTARLRHFLALTERFHAVGELSMSMLFLHLS